MSVNMRLCGVLMFVLLWCLISVVPSNASSSVSTSNAEKDSVLASFNTIHGITHGGGALFPEIKPLASTLSAVNGLFSLLLKSKQLGESPEVKLMEHEFGEINKRLDKVTDEDLDRIKHLIANTKMKTAFVANENSILNGFKELKSFVNELQNLTCNDVDDCFSQRIIIGQSHLPHFDISKNMDNIYRIALDNNTTAFPDSLLQHINKTYTCDVPKIQKFTDGILDLAFKEQQVTIAKNILTKSAYSISYSVENWMEQMYKLEEYSKQLIRHCLKNVKSFIFNDIKPPKYQSTYSSNMDAVNAIKKDLGLKYAWLDWIVMAFDINKDTAYQTVNIDGEFWAFPELQHGRRNIIVYFLDKGTYETQVKKDIEETLNYTLSKSLDGEVFKVTCNSKNKSFVNNPTKSLFKAIVSEMKYRGVWRYIKGLTLFNKETNFHFAKDSHHQERFVQQHFSLEDDQNNRLNFHLFVILKSEEERIFMKTDEDRKSLVSCNLPCQNGGTCDHLPYSSNFYCVCKPFYHGPRCEMQSNITLATNLETLLYTTLNIQNLDGIDLGVNDLSSYIGTSLGSLQAAIDHFGNAVEKAFLKLHEALPIQFRWQGLVTMYGEQLKKLQYFIKLFKERRCYKDSQCGHELRDLAEAVLGPQRYYGIRKWLHDFNNVVNGSSGFSLTTEEPLLITYMDHFKSQACSDEYKNAIDSVWRELMLLQTRGYLIWLQALHILNEPTEHVIKQYQDYTNSQVETMKAKTCNINIPGAVNSNCLGGFYMNERMTLTVICNANHYLVGNTNLTCRNPHSTCHSCNCSSIGSSSQDCADQTGKCSCHRTYYGDKCENHDCSWSTWSAWSTCPCGYSNQTRSRRVLQHGLGLGTCQGATTQTKPCFHTCCNQEFHCAQTSKCIPASQRCDNRHDCSHNEDETGCCETRHTTWDYNGGGNTRYIDRHHLDCGSQEKMITQFSLEASPSPGQQIRYVYTCCRRSTQFCHLRMVNNHPTESNNALIYLDQQSVDCGSNSVMNAFRLILTQNNRWYYQYKCCDINSGHSHNCQSKHSGWTTVASNKNFFLDRQDVRCDGNSYLSYFRLETSHGSIRYNYRCCGIS